MEYIDQESSSARKAFVPTVVQTSVSNRGRLDTRSILRAPRHISLSPVDDKEQQTTASFLLPLDSSSRASVLLPVCTRITLGRIMCQPCNDTNRVEHTTDNQFCQLCRFFAIPLPHVHLRCTPLSELHQQGWRSCRILARCLRGIIVKQR
jgi:hypothetical protein